MDEKSKQLYRTSVSHKSKIMIRPGAETRKRGGPGSRSNAMHRVPKEFARKLKPPPPCDLSVCVYRPTEA